MRNVLRENMFLMYSRYFQLDYFFIGKMRMSKLCVSRYSISQELFGLGYRIVLRTQRRKCLRWESENGFPKRSHEQFNVHEKRYADPGK